MINIFFNSFLLMKNDNQMILLIIILKAKNFRKREIYDIKHEIIKKFTSNTNIHFSLGEYELNINHLI
jgi:hypothetical protein